jgi:hypothetical protein
LLLDPAVGNWQLAVVVLRDCSGKYSWQLAVGSRLVAGLLLDPAVGNWQLAVVVLRDCFGKLQLAIGSWQSSCCGIASGNCSWQLAVDSYCQIKKKSQIAGSDALFFGQRFFIKQIIALPAKIKTSG